MISFQELLNHGTGSVWFFIPTAIFLGALHGLEPGHSKTMMAAFIIAIHGTMVQAVLLGLSAAFSHSLIIWFLALGALHFGSQWNAETTEPYFQILSGVIIVSLALWMFFRARRDSERASAHHHDPTGSHGGQLIQMEEYTVEICVFEDNVPPRFRIFFLDSHENPMEPPNTGRMEIETLRDENRKQVFSFDLKGNFMEAVEELPEPHEFRGVLKISHGNHRHSYTFAFHEHHHHHEGSNGSDQEYQDAHEKAHALDIANRFTDRTVTTGQIVIFGFTGGLLPCPAAFTILLVCLQLREFSLGFALVLSFSFGLAVTLVSTGVIAAWGVRHASKRFKGFGEWARRAPYLSVVLLLCLGMYIAVQGCLHFR